MHFLAQVMFITKEFKVKRKGKQESLGDLAKKLADRARPSEHEHEAGQSNGSVEEWKNGPRGCIAMREMKEAVHSKQHRQLSSGQVYPNFH